MDTHGFFVSTVASELNLKKGAPRVAKRNQAEREFLRGELEFSKETWRIFRIMAEFVESFERLQHITPAVSVFGSARLGEGHRFYQLGVDVGRRLAEAGFTVITGGGGGLMEAANRGAKLAVNGKSVGLNIQLPFEQKANDYLDLHLEFHYFFCRKVMFVKYATAFVILPGGFGTLDEMFEALTLMQTDKITDFPVILMGKEYWGGLVDWIQNTQQREGVIHPNDLRLLHITDNPDDAVKIIQESWETIKAAS